MQLSNIYPRLFILAVILTWIVGITITRKWPGGHGLSLSGHGASNRRAYLIFAASMIVGAVITYQLFTMWFIPKFKLPAAFHVLVLVLTVFTILAGLIPDTTAYQRKIHRFCAYSLAAFMPILLAFIALNSSVSLFARVACVVAIAYMIFVWTAFLLWNDFMKHYLLYQSAFVVSCQLAVLSAIIIQR